MALSECSFLLLPLLTTPLPQPLLLQPTLALPLVLLLQSVLLQLIMILIVLYYYDNFYHHFHHHVIFFFFFFFFSLCVTNCNSFHARVGRFSPFCIRGVWPAPFIPVRCNGPRVMQRRDRQKKKFNMQSDYSLGACIWCLHSAHTNLSSHTGRHNKQVFHSAAGNAKYIYILKKLQQ